MIHPSTFSIVATDLQEQAWGVAVASRFPAVGAVVPWAQAGAGAVATQSFANTSFGPRGLELMAGGLSAEAALSRLLADDSQREQRQVGLVDATGGTATFTGQGCFVWAGGLTGPGYAIQGNILQGAQVIQAMEQAFIQSKGELPDRLYAALLAGDRAGGDRRGRQSAALYVVRPQAGYGGMNDRWMDYRVDDHADPVAQLGNLLELHRLYFGHSQPEDRVVLTGEALARLQTILTRLGHYHGPADGRLDEATRASLAAFVGNENFEERCDTVAGWMDRPVFDFIIRKYEK